MSLLSLARSLGRMVRFHGELVRSYPPEWAEVVHEYREVGEELDTLKLREIVQYFGADNPKQRARLPADAPSKDWPVRTTDLAEYLLKNPENHWARDLLAQRGYVLKGEELTETREGERGRPRKFVGTVVGELSLYLRGEYQKVKSWDQESAVPGRLVGHIHKLLLPYFPDLSERTVSNALEDLERRP